jgi:endonuclease/exonuclease/phosphatase (EEP) superfamily protein YafD
MSTLFDLFTLVFLLWVVVWRLLGDRNGWLALANAWAWWLLTAAIPTGTAALWRRSRLAAFAWAFAGAVLWQRENGWTLPAPLKKNAPLPNPPRPTTSGSDKLSLLTFNLLNKKRELTPLLQLVARTAPDILLFQECIPSHAAQLEIGLAHCYPHRLWLPAPEYGMGFGIASRHPFALTGFWQYPGFEPFAARITLDLTGGPTVIDCRAIDVAGPPVRSGAELDIYCVQFISPTNEVRRVGLTALLRLRERQIDWVLAEIERRKTAAVVAGDWNSTEGSNAYRWAASQLADGWREVGAGSSSGNGPGWSWPRRLNPYLDSPAQPVLRLDYAMHTGSRYAPGLAVSQARVIRESLGSDHCPLLVEITSTPSPPPTS